MARIFDNIDQDLLGTLRATMQVSNRSDFCVGPSVWDVVSDWIDRQGPIANSKLREISGLDTLAASKQLRNWVTQGVLVALPAASRQMASYTKPELLVAPGDSLSLGLDNETKKNGKLF